MARAHTALLVPDPPSSWTPPIHAALEQALEAEVVRVAPGVAMPGLGTYRRIVSRLKFRHLAALPEMGWAGSEDLKVHWDEDGFWDGLWTTSPYRGMWSEHIPRLGFNLLVVTGQRSLEHFQERGIPTALLHKGYDPAAFADAAGQRMDVIAMYGQDYPSRVAARSALVRAGIPVTRVKAPFSRLASTLNGYLSVLICTLDVTVRGGRLGRRFVDRVPGLVSGARPGPEPMLKLFEAAACGCAPFTDFSPDLSDLGFVDGETAIIYRDIDELVEKAQHYRKQPDELRMIGARAARLVAEHHTWSHRAEGLARILDAHAAGRSAD